MLYNLTHHPSLQNARNVGDTRDSFAEDRHRVSGSSRQKGVNGTYSCPHRFSHVTAFTDATRDYKLRPVPLPVFLLPLELPLLQRL